MSSRLIWLAVFACSLWGQADRGTLTGTVVDPQGAGLADARLELQNQQNGTHYETRSTATGNYSLVQVPAGAYTLAVEFSGFKKYVQTGVSIQVAQTTRLDVPLDVGVASEVI